MRKQEGVAHGSMWHVGAYIQGGKRDSEVDRRKGRRGRVVVTRYSVGCGTLI